MRGRDGGESEDGEGTGEERGERVGVLEFVDGIVGVSG